MALGLALLATGTALKAYSEMKAGDAEAQALLEQIELNKIKERELADRLLSNIDKTERYGKSFQETQTASLAGSGFEVDGMATLQMLEDTVSKTLEEIDTLSRETNYEIESLQMENESLKAGAKRVKDASRLEALGTVLGGVSSGVMNSPKGKKPRPARHHSAPAGGVGPRLPRGR